MKNHDVPNSLPTILFPWGFVSGTLCQHTIYIHLYAHLILTSQCLGPLTDTSCNFPQKPTVCNTGTGFITTTVTFLKHFKFGKAAATTSPAPIKLKKGIITMYRPCVSVIASPLTSVSHYSGSKLPRKRTAYAFERSCAESPVRLYPELLYPTVRFHFAHRVVQRKRAVTIFVCITL